jgi:hypothetical protein
MSNKYSTSSRLRGGKIIPQELRDTISLRACSVKVAVALRASAFVHKMIRREKLVEMLLEFMGSDFALNNGLAAGSGGHDDAEMGSWEVLEKDRHSFIDGDVGGIRLRYNHSRQHYWLHSFDGTDRGILSETMKCVEVCAMCLLAFGGFVTDGGGNVTGRRYARGAMWKTKLDICAAIEPI